MTSFRIRIPASKIVYRILALMLLALCLTTMLVLAAPYLRWFYAVQQAGDLITHAIAWPAPRQVDALPKLVDDTIAEQALQHLVAATDARPDHFHAYRLAGALHAARGDWLRAAAALERARQLAPEQPMLAWETGLIYEQIAHVVATAPARALLDGLTTSTADVAAPTRTSFTLPYAQLNPSPSITTAEVLALSASARVTQTITLSDAMTALRFLLGCDPAARARPFGATTFRMWVAPVGGTPTVVYEQTLTEQDAQQGWLAAWADLSPWRAQTIVLGLETTSNAAPGSDLPLYGWGDLTLTTPRAARFATLLPQARMRQAWQAAGLTAAQFRGRAAQPGNAAALQAWEQRALVMEMQ